MSRIYNVRDRVYVKLHGLREFRGAGSCELHPRKYVVLFVGIVSPKNNIFLVV